MTLYAGSKFQSFFFFKSVLKPLHHLKKKKAQITELGGQRKRFDEKRNNSAPAENSWIS